MAGAYYNEIDPHAAQWLRNLIAAGHIAPGDVDERSILDVRADDLRGYTQCHFFAGIGVWSYALRQAGWPDDRPVWTGSCPCQPFSSAGKGLGHEDERHLWPTWAGLIRESRPHTVFGEQVANGDGYAWLDLVGNELESIGYALGALCPAACGVGAPHIRQRLYFVADANGERFGATVPRRSESEDPEQCSSGVGVAQGDTQHPGLEGHGRHGSGGDQPGRLGEGSSGSASSAGIMEHTEGGGFGVGGDAPWEGCGGHADGAVEHGQGSVGNSEWGGGRENITQWGEEGRTAVRGPSEVNGFWSGADWVWCRDPSGPRWRPVEPGTFPLAHGTTSRVVKLRAYGNAIVAPLAIEFIRAYIAERGL